MKSYKEINNIFNPTAIAVFGSMSAGKMGAHIASRIVAEGFDPSSVFAINPKAAGIDGITGYTSVLDVPRKIDLAIVVSPAPTVPGIMEDCGKAGIRSAVIISSGFSEAHNTELEKQVKEIAKRHGIRFVGPNCAGVANTACNLFATIEASPLPGRIGLISQSGAVGGMIMQLSNKYKLGIGKFASYGNAADLYATELIEYMGDDPDTSCIAIYVENIPAGRAFMESLRRVTLKKPVVIIKSGRTAGGQRAAMSHTGSMAGSDSVYDAAFAECGAIRADSVEQMFDICRAFDAAADMTGNKTAIITNSGGPGVMTADMCFNSGLDTAVPSEAGLAELKTFLPAHAGFGNPIDLTVEGMEKEYAESLRTVLKEYDAAIIIYVGVPYLAAAPIAQAIAQVRSESPSKPVTAFFEVGSDIVEAQNILTAANIPCFDSGERAADALGKLLRYHNIRRERLSSDHIEANLTPRVTQHEINHQYPALTEPQAMRLLGMAGISVPKFRMATSAETAVRYAEEIGYPVCMKVVSPQILHKSDVGGVILNIKTAEEAQDAFNRLKSITEGKTFLGTVIYPMLKTSHEVIMGLTRDPQFGPVVAFGMGGVYTEVFRDVALRVAPLTAAQADDMIRSVKSFPLLAGARGGQPVDLDALRDMLVRFSMLPFEYPQIAEADLNPVFARPDGATIADARIILS